MCYVLHTLDGNPLKQIIHTAPKKPLDMLYYTCVVTLHCCCWLPLLACCAVCPARTPGIVACMGTVWVDNKGGHEPELNSARPPAHLAWHAPRVPPSLRSDAAEARLQAGKEERRGAMGSCEGCYRTVFLFFYRVDLCVTALCLELLWPQGRISLR
jgi:hypothetical protein